MEGTGKVKLIVKGVLFSYLITLILIFLYSILLTYTSISESTIPTGVLIIGMVSVFISSSIAVIKIKRNGMKNGGIIGFCYILILYLLSSIYETGFALTKYSITTIIFYIFLGMIGGIVGANLVSHK